MERIQGRNDELVHVLQGLLQHSQIDAQWKGTIQKLLVNVRLPAFVPEFIRYIDHATASAPSAICR